MYKSTKVFILLTHTKQKIIQLYTYKTNNQMYINCKNVLRKSSLK